MPTAADYFDAMRAAEQYLGSLRDIDVYSLPATAQQLARLLGVTVMLNLVEHFGGLTLRIPYGETPQGRAMLADLARRVGEDAAQALAREYAGTRLYVPNCRQALVQVRDRAMLRDRARLAAEGLSERAVVQCLALRYGLSDRYVWRLLKKPPPEKPAPTAAQALLPGL